MTQIVYKLRHTPTGLFYQPSGAINTSKLGKVYSKAPARKNWVGISSAEAKRLGYDCPLSSTKWKTELSEWEVVEYTLTEVLK